MPPVCIKFYIQPALSLVVIFSYARPSNFPTPPLQVIIAQSLTVVWVHCHETFDDGLKSLYASGIIH